MHEGQHPRDLQEKGTRSRAFAPTYEAASERALKGFKVGIWGRG